MHRSHWSFQYGLGVQVGVVLQFKLWHWHGQPTVAGAPCRARPGEMLKLLLCTGDRTVLSLATSGFLPTYDVVGIPTMSYLPDVAYDIVGQDLRCRMCTTSYVMTYDIDIRHRMCPTYDVVTYDVHTISSKRTMSYVQTTMSYGFHRMRNRRLNQLHRMRHRIRCLHCFAPAAARGIRIRIAVFALAI